MIQKVIELFCTHGGKVLDPSGGTLTPELGATATNREYIVIEKDESYFNKAVQRLCNCVESKQNFVFFREDSGDIDNDLIDCKEKWSMESVFEALNLDREVNYEFISVDDAATDESEQNAYQIFMFCTGFCQYWTVRRR